MFKILHLVIMVCPDRVGREASVIYRIFTKILKSVLLSVSEIIPIFSALTPIKVGSMSSEASFSHVLEVAKG